MLLRALLPALLLMGAPAFSWQAWRVIGPGGGGAQFRPTISPHDVNRVLVACDMTGSYITHDGGASWRMFNLRGVSNFFVIDPVLPDVIYANTIGLWRSTDAGTTWNLVYPPPDSVTSLTMPGDHAEESVITSEPFGRVTALAVDPADSSILFAAIRAGSEAWLAVSVDAGASWNPLTDLPSGAIRVIADPRSAGDNRTLYVVGPNWIRVREAGEWRDGAGLPGERTIADISAGFPQGEGRPVFWATGDGLWVSLDGGSSWRSLRENFTATTYVAVATSLNAPNVAYVSYSGYRPTGSSSEYFGVAKTVDGGETWETVWREGSRRSMDVDDGWVSNRFSQWWGENPLSLGVAPTDPEIVYGTDYGRTLRSVDGGKTWRAAYTRRQEDGTVTSTGLDVTTAYGVHFDPFNSERVFISYTDIGLFRSENGGQSWTIPAPSGIPSGWTNTTYWIEFDPDVPGRLWAVMSGTHDLPRPKMWRRTSPSTFRGGALRSDDGGLRFRRGTGMPETAATHVLLDRRSPSESRTLYVAGFGKGVFKSTDGGDTWTLKNRGIEGTEPFAWRLAQDSQGTLYLIVARRSEDSSIGTPNDGALYRSTDGAESWTRITLPSGVNGPNGIAIDPDDPNRLYLAAWCRSVAGRAVGGGIYVSTDAGETWWNVLDRDQHVYDVTIDPREPSMLYACGFESSAWRSLDRGETWQRIPGYNFKWGHRVIPDPRDPVFIFVTTFGGSVWHGPAGGDPEAIEDIITPQLAYPKQ